MQHSPGHSDAATRARAQIRTLIEGGDWACSFARFGTLAHVCAQLAKLIEDTELARQADAVAQMIAADLDAATTGWSELKRAMATRVLH